jgi:hypothetical protein
MRRSQWPPLLPRFMPSPRCMPEPFMTERFGEQCTNDRGRARRWPQCRPSSSRSEATRSSVEQRGSNSTKTKIDIRLPGAVGLAVPIHGREKGPRTPRSEGGRHDDPACGWCGGTAAGSARAEQHRTTRCARSVAGRAARRSDQALAVARRRLGAVPGSWRDTRPAGIGPTQPVSEERLDRGEAVAAPPYSRLGGLTT